MRRAPRLAVVGPLGDLLAALRVGLEDHGFEVVTMGEAPSALEELLAAAPDLICLCVAINQEAGLELYTELTRHPMLSRRPVVVLEEAGDEANAFSTLIAARGVAAPAGILVSPFDLDELVRTANVLLGRPVGVAP